MNEPALTHLEKRSLTSPPGPRLPGQSGQWQGQWQEGQGTASFSGGSSQLLTPFSQHLLWLVPGWGAAGPRAASESGTETETRQWLRRGRGGQRLSSAWDEARPRRGQGWGGKACSPPGLRLSSHSSLFCAELEWEWGQPCVSWGCGAGAGAWERNCPWRLSDLKRTCPAAMSSRA